MPKVTVTGSGDDIIEIGGDVDQEFYFYSDDGRQGHLTFSDGTTMQIWYEGSTCLWRIREGQIGQSVVIVDGAQPYPGDPAYCRDFATIDGPFSWIEVGSDGNTGPRRIEVPTRQRA